VFGLNYDEQVEDKPLVKQRAPSKGAAPPDVFLEMYRTARGTKAQVHKMAPNRISGLPTSKVTDPAPTKPCTQRVAKVNPSLLDHCAEQHSVCQMNNIQLNNILFVK
jgi:hypothetical protein